MISFTDHYKGNSYTNKYKQLSYSLHIMTNIKSRTLKCSVCGKLCKRLWGLTKHQKVMHPLPLQPASRSAQDIIPTPRLLSEINRQRNTNTVNDEIYQGEVETYQDEVETYQD